MSTGEGINSLEYHIYYDSERCQIVPSDSSIKQTERFQSLLGCCALHTCLAVEYVIFECGHWHTRIILQPLPSQSSVVTSVMLVAT